MHSLKMRITVVFFLMTAAAVTVLTLIANWEAADRFGHYLLMQHAGGTRGYGMHHMMDPAAMAAMMGQPETEFLSSLRRSLLLAAATIVAAGAVASWWLARSVTVPLVRLNRAVQDVTAGNLGAVAEVQGQDEVAELARAFNTMTARLQAASTLRQRFLAGVAHELRTPLTVLQANLEGMLDGVIPLEREQVASLHEEVERLTKLVGDLRDLTLLEAGQLRLERAAVDANGVVRRSAARAAQQAADKDLAVRMELAENLPPLWADAVRLAQMVDNLLANAVHYTPAGGTITVSTTAASGGVCIRVADTGVGIAAEDLPHIFDHFYRADRARAKHTGGTGLGLAVVRQLAAAHGGRVDVASTPGAGSVFTVFLPGAKDTISS